MAKKTYADIAQQIINKYSKRGDADILANQAKEMQLKQLMNKQNVDKSVMEYGGIKDGKTQFLDPNTFGASGTRSRNLFDSLNDGTYFEPKFDENYSSDFSANLAGASTTDNNQQLSIQNDGHNSKFNYLDALSLAPVAYNAIQGMLPEQKLKASDYQVTDRIKPYKLNYDPAKQEALSSNRALNREIMNTGNKSVGDVIRNLRGSRLDYNKQVSDITSKEQMGNAAIDMQAQQANIGIDQSNKSIKFSVDDWNAKSKAARINMLGEAATQLSQFAQGKKTDKVTINAINSMLSNYMFDMNGNLVYKNTGKVVPQDEANQVKQVMVNK